MDRISWCGQRAEGFQFAGVRMTSLLFADDVVLVPLSPGAVWSKEEHLNVKPWFSVRKGANALFRRLL